MKNIVGPLEVNVGTQFRSSKLNLKVEGICLLIFGVANLGRVKVKIYFTYFTKFN